LDRFVAVGGHAIISGDVRMRERLHEMLALHQHEFLVLFYDRKTGGWNFFYKSAILPHWWEQVVEKIKTAHSSTFLAIPTNYPLSDKQLRQVSLRLPQILKDKPGLVERRAITSTTR
jgi:hypothetical protein